MLSSWWNTTVDFTLAHPNIFFTRADKGNVTIALNRDGYIEKMEETLADPATYSIVKKDPLKKMTNDLRELLKRWKNKKFISDQEYRALLTTDGVLPRPYGLPKIHKPGCPLRIIVSSINSPLYVLASYLHNIIYENITFTNTHLKNSSQLVNELGSITLESNYELVSLDVVSLFTNVPIELAINSIIKRWDSISKGTDIPKDEFILGIRLVLNSTFLSFNNRIYKQIFGSPMGSPLSPIIADITLQDIEEKAIPLLPFHVTVFRRYVDDVIMAAPPEFFDRILQIFNSFHQRLQFTLEISVNNTLNFLDVIVIVRENKFIFDWYHKPTFSGRYLNYHSHHPISHKRGVIYGLVDKIVLISHPQFHRKNFNLIIQILLDNGYPLPFIFSTIKNRLRQVFLRKNGGEDASSSLTCETKYFTVPYVKCMSDRFKNIAKDLYLDMAYSVAHPLKKFIKTGKDNLDKLAHSNVVYKIPCRECEATYVGQTKRQLKTRVKEHRSDINKNSGSPLVISCHRLETDHDFDWDNVEILDTEPSLRKRLISEMLYIKRQTSPLNKQKDTESLSAEYLPVLSLFPPR
ncbi:uncharacterized protein [Temnothorax nylanderi]|uniref:uncharacterized protein n=1 Tax=Temnothorax nylanderi TaxID=102681 RepID=UPI003A880138